MALSAPTWLVVVSLFQSIAAMSANLLTLFCIAKYKYLRTWPNLILASLAAGDFLHGFIAGLNTILMEAGRAELILCTVVALLEATSLYVQFINYLLLAAERQNSLQHLVKNKQRWRLKTICILVLVGWVSCTLWHIIVAALMITNDIFSGQTCEDIEMYLPSWYTSVTVVFILIMTSLICATYGSIGLMVRKSSHQVTSHMPMAMQQEQKRKASVRIASMMALVFGVFVCLYCPFVIAVLVISPTSPPWFHDFYYVTVVIYNLNFWVNPFIYVWRDKKFKKAFKTIFPRCCFNTVSNENNM